MCVIRIVVLGSPLILYFQRLLLCRFLPDVHQTIYLMEHPFSGEILYEQNFADFSLHESLQQALQSLGFTSPTPVQEQSIPAALEKVKTFLVSSQTGFR